MDWATWGCGMGIYGATPERRAKTRIITVQIAEEAGVYTHYDAEHCFLDRLRNSGMLGSEQDADDRYNSGYALRQAYYACHTSGQGALDAFLARSPHQYTDNDEAGALDRYHAILRALPLRYRPIAIAVCVNDYVQRGQTITDIRDMLDALYGALHRSSTAHEKNI